MCGSKDLILNALLYIVRCIGSCDTVFIYDISDNLYFYLGTFESLNKVDNYWALVMHGDAQFA